MSQEKEKTLLEKAAESQVWKSIFRGGGVPRNRRQRMMSVLNSVFLHLHPVRLPKHAVKLKFTWCMGGLSFFHISYTYNIWNPLNVLLSSNY